MKRKGSLSISTNAIVVLIVAVIMLGLIIGFVTKGFGAVEKKFLGQIEETEPEPPTPSSSTPITLSTGAKIVEPGELMGIKVKIVNTLGAKRSIMPYIKCSGEKDGNEDNWIFVPSEAQLFPKVLEPNEFASFTYINEVSDTTSGVKLCKVGAKSNDPTTEDMETSGWVVDYSPGGTDTVSIKPSEFRLEVQG